MFFAIRRFSASSSNQSPHFGILCPVIASRIAIPSLVFLYVCSWIISGEGVFGGRGYKSRFSFNRLVNLSTLALQPLFVNPCDTIASVPTVEEVKHSVINSAQPTSQFIDVVAQVICFRHRLNHGPNSANRANRARHFQTPVRFHFATVSTTLPPGCPISFPEENQLCSRHIQLRLKLSQVGDNVNPPIFTLKAGLPHVNI